MGSFWSTIFSYCMGTFVKSQLFGISYARAASLFLWVKLGPGSSLIEGDGFTSRFRWTLPRLQAAIDSYCVNLFGGVSFRLRIHHSKFDPFKHQPVAEAYRSFSTRNSVSWPDPNAFFFMYVFVLSDFVQISMSPWVCTTEEFEIKSSHLKKQWRVPGREEVLN